MARILLLALILSGCAKPATIREVEVVEVKVPVAVRVAPPPELLAPLDQALPVFVAPTDPAATSALTAEGERLLKFLLLDLERRLKAWEAWAR